MCHMIDGIIKKKLKMVKAAIASGTVSTRDSVGVGPTPRFNNRKTEKDAPPGMTDKQKKKWVEQQNAIDDDRQREERLRTDSEYKKEEEEKRVKEARERGRKINYANPQRGAKGKSNGGGLQQKSGSGANFAEGCVKGNNCDD